MRRLLVLLAGFGLLLGAALPAAAHPPGDPVAVGDLRRGLPVYLALGDSIALGQESARRRADDFEATVAAWRANGYAAQLAEVLVEEFDCLPARSRRAADGCRQLQYLNLARTAVPPGVPGQPPRPGVTTALLVAEQLPVATTLLVERNQDANPRNDVEVLTLTVGGNDVFGPVLAACVIAGTPTSPGCAATLDAVLRQVAAAYDQILAALRTAGGPDLRIVTMTYDNPLGSCFLGRPPFSATPLGDLVLEQFPVLVGGQPVGGLNGVISATSAAYDATVADTFGAWSGPGDLVGGADCLHPTRQGHTAIAEVFSDALGLEPAG